MATSTTPQPYTADRPKNSTTSVDANSPSRPTEIRRRPYRGPQVCSC